MLKNEDVTINILIEILNIYSFDLKYIQIMGNSEKLLAVIQFLRENNIKYVLNDKGEGHSNLWVPSYRIAVKITGKDDILFYDTHRRTCFPVFIRTEESIDFVIEKVQNTIIKSMKKAQNQILLKQGKEERKKKMKERTIKKTAKRRIKKKSSNKSSRILKTKSYNKDDVTIKSKRKRMRIKVIRN